MVDLTNSHIEVTDTKSKILAVANELFSKQGFDGVSVRDLANAADVNVAAINYHFKNKLNLYHEIHEYNYNWIAKELTLISEREDITVSDIAYEMYRLFSENGTILINSFKLILSDHLCPDEEMLKNQSKIESFGPPGGEALFKVITKEVGTDVPEEKRDWAMRMMFVTIVHIGTLINTRYVKARCMGEAWLEDIEAKELEIRELANALIDRIQK